MNCGKTLVPMGRLPFSQHHMVLAQAQGKQLLRMQRLETSITTVLQRIGASILILWCCIAGFVDIFVANEAQPNELWINDRTGNFFQPVGPEYPSETNSRAVKLFDYDGTPPPLPTSLLLCACSSATTELSTSICARVHPSTSAIT